MSRAVFRMVGGTDINFCNYCDTDWTSKVRCRADMSVWVLENYKDINL